MAMISRCPACTTLFKVVPDQLRISDGWVKCGMCARVFDASLHLFHATLHTDSIAPSEHPPPTKVPPAPVAARVVPAATPASAPTSPASPLPASIAPSRSEPKTADQVDSPVHPAADAHPDSDTVSFLQGRTVRRHRPVVRALWGLLAIVLALCLPGQWVYAGRDRLAALYPALQPALQSLCTLLHCTLSAPMQIESLVIDSAGFDRVSQGKYRLSFTLKNVSPITLALPAVELTLTDFADQPIIRRVWTPVDLGASSRTLAGGADWQVALSVRVLSDPAWPRVAGYRLMVFYP